MDAITLEGTSIKVLKDAQAIPYWFPINGTLILPNPAKDGLLFKYENNNVECKWASTGLASGGPAFVNMAAMVAQISTWQAATEMLLNSYGRRYSLIPSNVLTVTPHNDNDLPSIGILKLNSKTGVAGDICFIPADGSVERIWSYDLDTKEEMLVKRVKATGTTATGIELWVL